MHIWTFALGSSLCDKRPRVPETPKLTLKVRAKVTAKRPTVTSQIVPEGADRNLSFCVTFRGKFLGTLSLIERYVVFAFCLRARFVAIPVPAVHVVCPLWAGMCPFCARSVLALCLLCARSVPTMPHRSRKRICPFRARSVPALCPNVSHRWRKRMRPLRN